MRILLSQLGARLFGAPNDMLLLLIGIPPVNEALDRKMKNYASALI
ncbi:MAG TPA: hypothetical protein VF026_25280 [Ktedonobacteraceae bacterium]